MLNSFYEIKNVKSRCSGKNIYKTFFLIIFFSPLFWRGAGGEAFSQTAPGIEWQNTIGGSDSDQLHSLQQTTDGGYILGGTSTSNISGDKTENNWDTIFAFSSDYWIIKTDALGNIQWQNTIGGTESDNLNSLRQTSDGGYILGGTSFSNISGDKTENNWNPTLSTSDYWIVITDFSGNIQWQNTIGGGGNDELQTLQQTTDGGYMLGGTSTSNISGDKTENSMNRDYWIVKTDASGNIQWQNTIGGNDTDELFSIQQTSDGGYIIGGWSSSNISGDKTENNIGAHDYWIVKTDFLGNIQWQNTIGGNNDDKPTSIQQTTDGGYIVGGYSWSNISGDKIENSNGLEDYWLVKTDALGNIQWQNTIGGTNYDQLCSVEQTLDGGYILGGSSISNISGDKTENCWNNSYDFWIIKTNNGGIIEWQNTIGGNGTEVLFSLQQTTDGGYVSGGWSASNISGDKTENSWNNSTDYWIIKLAPDTITGISLAQSAFGGEGVAITPNPLVTQCTLAFSNPQKEKFLFTLYDITGRVIETVNTTTEQIFLTKGSKPAGVYLFHLDKLGVANNEKTGERMNGKIIIQ